MRRVSRLLSMLLIICIAWTPFSLEAALVGTDQVLVSTQAQDGRDKVISFLQRTDVARQLEHYGVSSTAAEERVNAMTPEEIGELAAHIDSLPAGAAASLSITGTSWLIAAIIALIIFFVWYRRA